MTSVTDTVVTLLANTSDAAATSAATELSLLPASNSPEVRTAHLDFSALSPAAGPPAPLPVLILKIAAMAAIILLSVLGNLLVIVSVLLHRRIRVVANYFVVSLAAADMLVALCAMTFNASIQITGKWQFGSVMCDTWNSLDVFFSTVSILHLCCISVDRYAAIVMPLEYRRKMSRRTVAAMITASWTAPVLISFVPIFFGWYTHAEHLQQRAAHPDRCEFIVNRTYMLVSSSVSFWLPGVVMVCMYSRIYREARRQHRAVSRTPSSANFSAAAAEAGSCSIADFSDEQLALALTALNDIREEPEDCGQRVGSSSSDVVTKKDVISDPSVTSPGCQAAPQPPQLPPRAPLVKKASTVSFCDGKLSFGNGSGMGNGNSSGNAEFQRKSSTNSRLGRLRYSTSQMLREHKAAKTLGVIMGCFVLCWLPFFSWYVSTTLCGAACHVPPVLVDVLFWIGYFNSTLNPMIYAYFNTEFRDAFRQTLLVLLCCRWRHKDRLRGATARELAGFTSSTQDGVGTMHR